MFSLWIVDLKKYLNDEKKIISFKWENNKFENIICIQDLYFERDKKQFVNTIIKYFNNNNKIEIKTYNDYNFKKIEKEIKIEIFRNINLKKIIEKNWDNIKFKKWDKINIKLEFYDIFKNKYKDEILIKITKEDENNYENVVKEFLKFKYNEIFNIIVFVNVELIKVENDWLLLKDDKIINYILRNDFYFYIESENKTILDTTNDNIFEWIYNIAEFKNKLTELDLKNKILKEILK